MASSATRTWPPSRTRNPSPPSRGYTIYKGGFWSQGPAMIRALNILTVSTSRPSPELRRIHSHARQALKLAYATHTTATQFTHPHRHAPQQRVWRRHSLIGNASANLPRQARRRSTGIRRSLPSSYNIPDALMARDTTCVRCHRQGRRRLLRDAFGSLDAPPTWSATGFVDPARRASAPRPSQRARPRQAPARDSQPTLVTRPIRRSSPYPLGRR